jgi:Skp family chaperone for outer membrane proteins
MSKDLNKQVEKLEEGVKKYASKDTVISIGGYEFTPAKLMIAFTIASTTLGGLYGIFEVYKGYQDMKMKIEKYVAPDLSEFDKRLILVEETSSKTNDYTRDIKNDIKNDIRKLESIVEQVERTSKQSQRETDQDIRQLRKEIDSKIQKALDNPLAGK